jgi:hypothetical protein
MRLKEPRLKEKFNLVAVDKIKTSLSDAVAKGGQVVL